MGGTWLSTLGEITFYVAVATLLVIFFFKKRKQVLNTNKEQSEKRNQ
jgi:hypothetical protein